LLYFSPTLCSKGQVDEDTEQKKTSDVDMNSNIGIPAVHQAKDRVSLYLQIVALCVTGLCLYEGFEL